MRTELDARQKSKPGPKPKPLAERANNFRMPVKRAIKTRSREEKLAVLRYWRHGLIPDEKKGVGFERQVTLREVAFRYKVPESTISDWKKNEKNILQTRAHGRSQQRAGIDFCKYRELEEKLYQGFCDRRDSGLVVRRIWFRLASKLAFKEAYPELDPAQFTFSDGWFRRFLTRWNITFRSTTNKAQHIPNHYRILIEKWLQFNRRNAQPRLGDYKYEIGRYDLAHIVNMDQTPLPFEYITGRTYAHKGDKTIWAKSAKSGWDKRQATLVLTVFADGVGRVKPLILFKGTEDSRMQERYYGEERKQYDKRVEVWFNPKGYANTQTTVKWIYDLLIPGLHPAGTGPRMWNSGPSLLQSLPSGKPQPSIIALDAARFHLSPEVLDTLRDSDIIPSLIPGGCTGLIQVLDVSVNKPLKELIRNELDTILESMGQEALDALDDASSSAIGKRRIIMTHVVGAAWEKFCNEKQNVIIKAFRMVGMSLPINGVDDHELHIKGLSNLQVGDWRREEEPIGDAAGLESELDADYDHSEELEYDYAT